MNVAILGANGFIGSRAVEMLHLRQQATVRPVVRTVASLARLSRFDLDSRIADACDEPALCQAFAGCDAVIHAVAGNPRVILETVAPTYRAAQAAGVRRLIYLSSASVHGQAAPPGTDEASPLSDQQPLPYNNAKVRAERRLQELRAQGSVELVILRPGIVFGPRSSWITGFATDLLAGTAYMAGDGRGICNSIYVDNLIHALVLAMGALDADRQAFLLGDSEVVTWADFYRPVAEALGFSLQDVTQVAYAPSIAGPGERLRALLAAGPSRALRSTLPRRLRRALRAGLHVLLESPRQPQSAWSLPEPEQPPRPVATLEMALLHRCRYKLPYTKAARLLGYDPVVSFAEGCRRTIAWLAFAGYPVVTSDDSGEPR